MKTTTTALLLLACALPATAALVASYDAGVNPAANITGAADPTTQGWTFAGITTNNYVWAGDSTIGGWRVMDESTAVGTIAHYSQAIGTADLADMNTFGWEARWTVAISQDAMSKAGGGVEGYYGGANYARQSNNGLLVESASGANDYAYYLSFATNAAGDYLVKDSVNTYTIASGNQLSSELNGTTANYVTLTLTYTPGAGAYLTDSLGGDHGLVSTWSGYTPQQDRVVWGAHTSSGQGGTVWNELSLVTVPEPGSSLLLGLSMMAGVFRRRR